MLGLTRDILLAGFFLLPLIGLLREIARRRRALAAVAPALREVGHVLRDPVVDLARSTVSGLAHGLRTTFRMTTRVSDSASEPWTEVDVLLPTGTPLAMELRPRTDDEDHRIARGLAVDVDLDDPAFGPLFVVEAAPADVVRALLDDGVRARLGALYPCEVTGSVQGLRFAKRGWQEGGREAVEIVDLTTTIAARIAIAVSRANEARMSAAAAGGAGYRGLEAESLGEASWYLEPSEEVLTLHEVRARRAPRRRRRPGDPRRPLGPREVREGGHARD